jgi:hypothetical protein
VPTDENTAGVLIRKRRTERAAVSLSFSRSSDQLFENFFNEGKVRLALIDISSTTP